MTSMNRSRRRQAALAGLGVVSALGAAVGLGLTTHPHNSFHPATRSAGTDGSSAAERGRSDDENRTAGRSSAPQKAQAPRVTPPGNGVPQATTSGS